LRVAQADAARLTGQAADVSGLFEYVQVVLRGTNAAETERVGNFGLGWRHALLIDALGDEAENGLLIIGNVH